MAGGSGAAVSIRLQIFISSLLVVLIPIGFLAWVFRGEMTTRAEEQYEEKVEALLTVIEDDFASRTASIASRLAALKGAIRDDNRFRLAMAGDESERAYLLDYASRAKELMGFDLLQIQDESGRIVSSGHYRNEFDRIERSLPVTLSKVSGGSALVTGRKPSGSFLALAAAERVRLGSSRLFLVGGFRVDGAFLGSLVPDADMAAALLVPGRPVLSGPNCEELIPETARTPPGKNARARGKSRSTANSTASDSPDSTDADSIAAGDSPAASGSDTLTAPIAFTREITIPMISADGKKVNEVRLVVAHDRRQLDAMLHRLGRLLRIAVGLSAACAFLLALWMSARVSRPIRRLAEKAATIDLDRLDAHFESRRRDEVGALSRLLGEMTGRLRASTVRLRDTERRATLGEIARQVNHDLRNGLTPIRNVFRHLVEVARDDPASLPAILDERRGTIDSGLNYLEDLSKSYSRLSTKGGRSPCDLNDVIRDLVGALSGGEVQFICELDGDLPGVRADVTGLRRIVENLVRNGMESLPSGEGSILIRTESGGAEEGEPFVTLSVKDNGCGMDAEKQERIFDHFFTYKEGGTGLGLSIVRRLVTDFEGTIDVKSAPGKGTLFTVTFPAASRPAEEGER